MIEFIIYDDQEEFREKIKKTVESIAVENKIKSEIKCFNKYNKDFETIINDKVCSKIYLLDIDVPNSYSGIDIARKIRRKDWNSIIILITSHVELGYEALKAQIMLLDFICKQNNCTKNLKEALSTAIKKVNFKKVLVFENNGITNRVYTDDIVYILKDNIERKCIIKTTYNEILLNKTLSELKEELDKRFYSTSRSCIVNTDKIRSVEWKKSIINFNNGDSTDYLSRDRKKGLKDYVGNK